VPLANVMTPEPMRPGWDDALRYSMMRLPYERLLDIDARLAEAAARPVVFPETLIYDHGKPYQADTLRRACLRLGINPQDARQLTPTDKAMVERVFGTIRTQFSEHVAGYKSYDVAHRGRDVEAVARWSLAELEEFFAEYVVAVYQRQHHDGLIVPGFPGARLSPNEAYALALTYTGYVACPTDPNLYYDLLPIEKRTIQPGGRVEIDSLIYNADVLVQYGNSRSPYPDGLWPIRHDPRNRLHAYFQDPADGGWHLLRWTHAPDGCSHSPTSPCARSNRSSPAGAAAARPSRTKSPRRCWPCRTAPTRPSRGPAPTGAVRPATPNGPAPPPATGTGPTRQSTPPSSRSPRRCASFPTPTRTTSTTSSTTTWT